MIIGYIFITIFTFGVMEGITWCTHKFVMHGFLWYLHEDHHQPKYKGLFEKNDAFFVIFALPSAALIILGTTPSLNWLFFVGLGIMFYGAAYFLVHDVLIHQRFNWFKKTDSAYLKALRKAHKVHHKHLNKMNGECFGMLIVPKKYYAQYQAK
ncbi:MAG: sterol desaturase family protein [Flavobacteriales bacterium]|jgi:beta-carotene 3-hydroxylase